MATIMYDPRASKRRERVNDQLQRALAQRIGRSQRARALTAHAYIIRKSLTKKQRSEH